MKNANSIDMYNQVEDFLLQWHVDINFIDFFYEDINKFIKDEIDVHESVIGREVSLVN